MMEAFSLDKQSAMRGLICRLVDVRTVLSLHGVEIFFSTISFPFEDQLFLPRLTNLVYLTLDSGDTGDEQIKQFLSELELLGDALTGTTVSLSSRSFPQLTDRSFAGREQVYTQLVGSKWFAIFYYFAAELEAGLSKEEPKEKLKSKIANRVAKQMLPSSMTALLSQRLTGKKHEKGLLETLGLTAEQEEIAVKWASGQLAFVNYLHTN